MVRHPVFRRLATAVIALGITGVFACGKGKSSGVPTSGAGSNSGTNPWASALNNPPPLSGSNGGGSGGQNLVHQVSDGQVPSAPVNPDGTPVPVYTVAATLRPNGQGPGCGNQKEWTAFVGNAECDRQAGYRAGGAFLNCVTPPSGGMTIATAPLRDAWGVYGTAASCCSSVEQPAIRDALVIQCFYVGA